MKPRTPGPKRLTCFSGSTRREFAVRLGPDGGVQVGSVDGRGPVAEGDRALVEAYADRLRELLSDAEAGRW